MQVACVWQVILGETVEKRVLHFELVKKNKKKTDYDFQVRYPLLHLRAR